jgi:tetratricopeptide (TPR) repeat protein
MLRKLTFYLLTLCLYWPAAQNWSAAQAPAEKKEKKPKDREEYDLYNNFVKETDPNKRIQILDQWKQKYPDSDYVADRLKFYLAVYQQLNQGAKAVEYANQVLVTEPDDFAAHFAIAAFTPYLGSTDPKVLSGGEKAANAVLQLADKQFAPDKKPPNVDDATWAGAKKSALTVAHQCLGWVAKTGKKYDVAEQELIKTLDLTPTGAMVSYWLGETVMAEKNPDKYPLAFFSFARAASYAGPGALPPNVRQQVDAYLSKVYKNYHGDDAAGLAELKKLAMASPLPPPDLKIKSADEVRVEKEEELKKNNPLLATFIAIKDGLTGQDGATFWNSMKGTAMPKLRGTVVSAKPAVKPKVVELAMSQSTTTEITLTAPEASARCKLDPGATVEFDGAEPKEFTPNPFMLKMEGGKIVTGCTDAPAPVKKAAPKKAGAPAAKKKAP